MLYTGVGTTVAVGMVGIRPVEAAFESVIVVLTIVRVGDALGDWSEPVSERGTNWGFGLKADRIACVDP